MSGRLNWNKPRRVFPRWYEADLLPWDARLESPNRIARSLVVRSKPSAPKATPQPIAKLPATKSPAVAAGAFVGKAALRTWDLIQARQALAMATEAVVYCDGSAAPKNPGIMGMGAVIVAGTERVELYNGGSFGSNNAAELAAAIMALEALPLRCRVTMISDSTYLVHGMTQWVDGWRRKGFKRAGVDIPSAALWRQLDALNSVRSIRWEWQRGHTGNIGNELADRLAALGRGWHERSAP